ncbi:AraC family transcriptional regulator N-terminal domain-containing protein [Mycobacterium sp. NPDC003449]
MTATTLPAPHGSPASALTVELATLAHRPGANTGLWPGLTIYRFTEPTERQWEEIGSLSVGIVAQGRKAVTVGDRHVIYDPFNYLVIRDHRHFQCQVLDATPEEPFLSLVLQIEPALVRQVSAAMRDPGVRPAEPGTHHVDGCVVSALDDDLAGSVLRFLRSLSTASDRSVLAPLYLRELVYRVLQHEQFPRMRNFAADQLAGNPVAAALAYIDANLAEPLTVPLLAAQANLSPSAFSRTFREVTGRSPYNFVKEARLNRARELIVERDASVTGVAVAVGYASTSHFIKEFRTRFGTTPKQLVDLRS